MTFDEWWNNWSVKDWNDIKSAKNLFQQAFEAGLHADVHTDNSKVIAELEEKLANADYQLEGRDLKIKELEAEKDKAWWEGFDTCKAKAGEANVKLSEELETERKKNAELTEQIEELKCCANCKYEEQGYMIEPCKSCNRYFQTLKVGARDKWEKR